MTNLFSEARVLFRRLIEAFQDPEDPRIDKDAWLSPSGDIHFFGSGSVHSQAILDLVDHEALVSVADSLGIDREKEDAWAAMAALRMGWARIKYVKYNCRTPYVFVASPALSRAQRSTLEAVHFNTGVTIKADLGRRHSILFGEDSQA